MVVPDRVTGNGATGTGIDAVRIVAVTSVAGHRTAAFGTDAFSAIIAAGVPGIEMHLNNFGPAAVDIRIVFFGPGGMYASSNRVSLAAGSGWQHAVDSLAPANMWYVNGGTTNLADTLTGVTTLLIRHDSNPPTQQGAHPPHITGTLGIDNIQALPEPGLIFMGVSLIVIWLRRQL